MTLPCADANLVLKEIHIKNAYHPGFHLLQVILIHHYLVQHKAGVLHLFPPLNLIIKDILGVTILDWIQKYQLRQLTKIFMIPLEVLDGAPDHLLHPCPHIIIVDLPFRNLHLHQVMGLETLMACSRLTIRLLSMRGKLPLQKHWILQCLLCSLYNHR